MEANDYKQSITKHLLRVTLVFVAVGAKRIDLNMLNECEDPVSRNLVVGRSVDGERALSMRQRIHLLMSGYASLLARYSLGHPDVVNTANEIEMLEGMIGASKDPHEFRTKLLVLRSRLTILLKKYSSEHPDVEKRRRKITVLESTFELSGGTSSQVVFTGEAENPTYIIILRAQLESVASDMKSLKITKRNLKFKQDEIKTRLLNTPQVEQAYQVLLREYANAVRRYQEIKAKEMEAGISEQLEVERKGERFSLLEPPQLPKKAVKPNRKAILFLEILLAIAVSMGFAAVMEALDQSVYFNENEEKIARQSLLAVVPYLESYDYFVRAQTVRRFQVAGGVVAMFIIVLFIHFILRQLNILWYQGVNKLTRSASEIVGA